VEVKAKTTFDIRTDLSPNVFKDTLRTARKGDWIIYHAGITANGPHCKDAMKLALLDKVALVQRRVATKGEIRFEYIAEKQ